jgi:hypothetical protein
MRMKSVELFKQLPVGHGAGSWPPFPDGEKNAYPALAERFEVLDSEVLPAFLEMDAEASAAQIRYRRFRLALMTGAGLTTVAGALLAALGGATWPGLIVAVLGLATTALANLYRRDQPLERYLTSRAKAEHLRSIYFRYLSGIDGSDRRTLEKRVAAIAHSRSSEAGNG